MGTGQKFRLKAIITATSFALSEYISWIPLGKRAVTFYAQFYNQFIRKKAQCDRRYRGTSKE